MGSFVPYHISALLRLLVTCHPHLCDYVAYVVSSNLFTVQLLSATHVYTKLVLKGSYKAATGYVVSLFSSLNIDEGFGAYRSLQVG